MTFLCKWVIFRVQPLIFRGVPLFYTNLTHQQADLDLQDLRLSRSILTIWNTLDAMNHSRRLAFPSISTESPQLSVTWNEDINFPQNDVGFLANAEMRGANHFCIIILIFLLLFKTLENPMWFCTIQFGTCENTNLSNGKAVAGWEMNNFTDPALKLTASFPLKINGWKITCAFGAFRPIF